MPAYNFKAQFAAAVERGEKTQTIRAPRKNGHAQVGGKVHLYTGMRTKSCRRLGIGRCTRSSAIHITPTGISISQDGSQDDGDDIWLAGTDADDFAIRDGFTDFKALLDFFKDDMPFHGQLICWELPDV